MCIQAARQAQSVSSLLISSHAAPLFSIVVTTVHAGEFDYDGVSQVLLCWFRSLFVISSSLA